MQLDRQQFPIPAGIECELVVGQHIGAAPGGREMRELYDRYLLHPDQPGGFKPAMPGNDLIVIGDQDRIGETKLADARGNLPADGRRTSMPRVSMRLGKAVVMITPNASVHSEWHKERASRRDIDAQMHLRQYENTYRRNI